MSIEGHDMTLHSTLLRRILLCQVLAVAVGVSCGVSSSTDSSQNSDSANPRESVQHPTGKPPAQATSANSTIRGVNFNNFTYPWYPKFLTPPSGQREISLQNGHFEVGLDRKNGTQAISVDLEHVYYADLTGDGVEEAVVYLAGSVPTNSFFGNLLIYTMKETGPTLLWQHETGDRGNNGLRGFRVENGEFILEEYSEEANPQQSLCCPKYFLRSYYRWTNNQFTRAKSEVLANEYSNAYFVGYPKNSQ
jgi:hypothetical protein